MYGHRTSVTVTSAAGLGPGRLRGLDRSEVAREDAREHGRGLGRRLARRRRRRHVRLGRLQEDPAEALVDGALAVRQARLDFGELARGLVFRHGGRLARQRRAAQRGLEVAERGPVAEAGRVELAGFFQRRARRDEVGVLVDRGGRPVGRQELAFQGVQLGGERTQRRGSAPRRFRKRAAESGEVALRLARARGRNSPRPASCCARTRGSRRRTRAPARGWPHRLRGRPPARRRRARKATEPRARVRAPGPQTSRRPRNPCRSCAARP